jgi:hypothetical protein
VSKVLAGKTGKNTGKTDLSSLLSLDTSSLAASSTSTFPLTASNSQPVTAFASVGANAPLHAVAAAAVQTPGAP